jgi:bacillithiol system protein YtxJ
MSWLFSRSNSEPASAGWDLHQIQQLDLAIIFKHSSACPVSWAAQRQVNAFAEQQPGAPLFRLTVQKHRPLSNQIAEQTGVRHESPQILVLRRGKVVSHTSHGGITVDYLKEVLTLA